MAILELTLKTGLRIWASALHMDTTYGGLLEGYPFAAFNDDLVARLPRRATELFGDWPVQLIAPSRSIREGTAPAPLGPPEYLPSLWIAAAFNSLPLRDLWSHGSQLIVVWFQEEPFPVPAEAVLQELQAIPWETVACDFEY